MYTVLNNGGRMMVAETAAEAVQAGSRDVYLAGHAVGEHVDRLEKTGETAWAYGFSTIHITAGERKGVTVDDLLINVEITATKEEAVLLHGVINEAPIGNRSKLLLHSQLSAKHGFLSD